MHRAIWISFSTRVLVTYTPLEKWCPHICTLRHVFYLLHANRTVTKLVSFHFIIFMISIMFSLYRWKCSSIPASSVPWISFARTIISSPRSMSYFSMWTKPSLKDMCMLTCTSSGWWMNIKRYLHSLKSFSKCSGTSVLNSFSQGNGL